MKLKVTPHDLVDSVLKSTEQLWRSLENTLEAQKRTFELNDAEKAAFVEVADESDARILMRNTFLKQAVLLLPGGTSKIINAERKKVAGRPRNMVFDSTIGKGMSLNQYTKHMKDLSISKAEVIKKGILTKAQLEKAIQAGQVSVVQVASQTRITKASLQKFFNSM